MGDLNCHSEEIRRLRHQFKNHLQIILGLSRLGDPEDVVDYIKSLQARYEGRDVLTGDKLLALLFARLRECLEAGLRCRLEIAGWARLSGVSSGEIARLEQMLEDIASGEEPVSEVRVVIDGERGLVEVALSLPSGETEVRVIRAADAVWQEQD